MAKAKDADEVFDNVEVGGRPPFEAHQDIPQVLIRTSEPLGIRTQANDQVLYKLFLTEAINNRIATAFRSNMNNLAL